MSGWVIRKLAVFGRIFQWHRERLCLHDATGAEWWALWLDGEDDVGWHWDADYECRERGQVQHPFLGVTYLEEGSSATVVLEGSDEALVMAGGAIISTAHLSLPMPGKHICFDGQLLHAAPSKLRSSFQESQRSKSKRRCARTTLLVNVWCGHQPSAARLPQEVAKRLSPVVVASSFALGYAQQTPSQEVIVGRGVAADELAWSFGEADVLSVSMPVPRGAWRADSLTLRFTDGRCGCVG